MKKPIITKPNESNASTTRADKVIVEDWNEEEDSDTDTVNDLTKTSLNSVISNNSVLGDVKTIDSVALCSSNVLVLDNAVVNDKCIRTKGPSIK